MLFYGTIVEQSVNGITFGFMHISCLVHGLHGVWCLFQGWDVGTLGWFLSGCVTQDPRVGPSEACAIYPTHPVRLGVCTCM